MIIGMGNDICVISRVQAVLDKHPTRFVERCFTQVEREKSEKRKNKAASYAKRFAAKEACAKALGTGISQGVFWRDMGVVNLPSGKPTFQLQGGAYQKLLELMPSNYEPQIHLTITDDGDLAQAFVIIEALKPE